MLIARFTEQKLKCKGSISLLNKNRIKFMHRNAIDFKDLTGTERNKRILIPRKNLTYSGTILSKKSISNHSCICDDN
jgi:hypothetical protein